MGTYLFRDGGLHLQRRSTARRRETRYVPGRQGEAATWQTAAEERALHSRRTPSTWRHSSQKPLAGMVIRGSSPILISEHLGAFGSNWFS